MEDKEIMKWYRKGWRDESTGSSSILPNDRPDISLCYSIGALDCISGNGVPSNEEIIKDIKEKL